MVRKKLNFKILLNKKIKNHFYFYFGCGNGTRHTSLYSVKCELISVGPLKPLFNIDRILKTKILKLELIPQSIIPINIIQFLVQKCIRKHLVSLAMTKLV